MAKCHGDHAASDETIVTVLRITKLKYCSWNAACSSSTVYWKPLTRNFRSASFRLHPVDWLETKVLPTCTRSASFVCFELSNDLRSVVCRGGRRRKKALLNALVAALKDETDEDKTKLTKMWVNSSSGLHLNKTRVHVLHCTRISLGTRSRRVYQHAPSIAMLKGTLGAGEAAERAPWRPAGRHPS